MTEVIAGFLCDDIRQETTGKLLIVGLYSQDVVFAQLPAAAAFAMGICIRLDTESPAAVALRIRIDDATVAELQGDMQGRLESPFWLPLPPIPMRVERPGTLRAEASIAGGPWRTFLEIPVRDRPAPPAP